MLTLYSHIGSIASLFLESRRLLLDNLSGIHIQSIMSTETLFLLSALIPVVLMPFIMPMVAMMARRKNITDSPNARKLQHQPVMVLGGMVIIAVLSITLMFINVFYDLSNLFTPMCVLIVFFILGLLDDSIGLNYKVKLYMQILLILMLFFCGEYRASGLLGLYGVYHFSTIISLIVTVFLGLLYVNAINFVDGIDGLASAIGVLGSIMLFKWNQLLGMTEMAFFSCAMAGVFAMFFLFNVFSSKYKMYMGDSGSLILGFFIFISVCPNGVKVDVESSLITQYAFSYMLATFSVPLFDIVRVVIFRVLNGKSPFEPDRTHLHHAIVDMGVTHFLATIIMIFFNLCILLVWFLTAKTGMSPEWQLPVVVLSAIALIWGAYFLITINRDRYPERYGRWKTAFEQYSSKAESAHNFVGFLIDRRIKVRKNKKQ